MNGVERARELNYTQILKIEPSESAKNHFYRNPMDTYRGANCNVKKMDTDGVRLFGETLGQEISILNRKETESNG